MSGRIVKLNTSTHQTVQELLPWFAMNTLDADEMALVREHVRTCTQCQADADWQHKLRAANSQPGAIPDVERALARLRPQQLQAPQRKHPRHVLSAFLLRLFGASASWMRWAVLIQAVMIVILTILLVPPYGGIALYRVLGAPGNAAGNVVVMFKPETTEQELRKILQESGARVVDGPTVAHAYVLNVPEAQLKRTIGVLRSKRAVALAEPLESGEGR